MSTSEATTETFLTLVFKGLAIGTDKEEIGAWAELVEGNDAPISTLEDLKEHCYATKKMPKCRPGAIYKFRSSPDVGVFINNPIYVGEWHNKEETTKLQITYDAFRAEMNAKRLEKSAVGKNLPFDLLEPFRQVYRHSNPMQRSAIILQVVSYLKK